MRNIAFSTESAKAFDQLRASRLVHENGTTGKVRILRAEVARELEAEGVIASKEIRKLTEEEAGDVIMAAALARLSATDKYEAAKRAGKPKAPKTKKSPKPKPAKKEPKTAKPKTKKEPKPKTEKAKTPTPKTAKPKAPKKPKAAKPTAETPTETPQAAAAE